MLRPKGHARRRWDLLLALAAIAVLMAPMVLTDSTFGGDWPGHLWLVQMQARNISYLGHPSLFVQSSLGAFEPWYAFYGGTLYSFVGALAVLSGGHTLAMYVLSFAMAMAMAYGGFVWIARQTGSLRGWPAHIGGFVFVSSAYYISDLYARGAWPETVATSSIPLVVASGLWLLRAERWRVGPVAAFVFAVVLFTGSHNITLLYGSVFLVLLCLSLAVAVGREGLPSPRRGAAVLGLAVLAGAVNLWFLLPDLVYQGRTTIGHSFTAPPAIAGGLPLSRLLDPVRDSRVPGFPTLDMQIPTLAVVWCIAVLAVAWRGLPRRWRRLAVALALPGLPFLLVLAIPELWHALPKLLWAVQFPYRLLTYVDFSVVGLVMVAVVAMLGMTRTRARGLLLVLGAVFALAEGAQAIDQEWSTPSSLHSRSEVFPGGSKLPDYWIRFATYLEFQDVSLPVISATIPELPGVTVYNGQGANVVPVPVTERPRDGYAVTLNPPKDGTVNTDVISGPYLVAVHGAKFVGRTPYSELVMQVNRNPHGPTRVTFSTARTWPIVLGKWVTVLALLSLAALLAVLALRQLAARARGGSSRAWTRRRPAS